MNEERYMRLALELAARGEGRVSPNPLVGAVLVRDGKVIGTGWHKQCGGPHAEREALAACTEDPKGADLYVTLEPCCHEGRTPPCTTAIIQAGIRRVIAATEDPNPLVGGKGIRILQEAGIQVEIGMLEEQARKQNRFFFHHIRNKTPFVTLKYAMTLDGKIATRTGASRWITGEEARRHVHQSRHRHAGIMTGVGTVIADDPMLDCRLDGGRNPVRIICDTNLRIPMTSRIVNSARGIPTWIATSSEDMERIRSLEAKGCRILRTSTRDGVVDLKELMTLLGRQGINSILLEGGASLNYSALNAGIITKVQAYLAPKLFGGAEAPTPLGGLGIALPEGAIRLGKREVAILGEDLLIEYEVMQNVHWNH